MCVGMFSTDVCVCTMGQACSVYRSYVFVCFLWMCVQCDKRVLIICDACIRECQCVLNPALCVCAVLLSPLISCTWLCVCVCCIAQSSDRVCVCVLYCSVKWPCVCVCCIAQSVNLVYVTVCVCVLYCSVKWPCVCCIAQSVNLVYVTVCVCVLYCSVR